MLPAAAVRTTGRDYKKDFLSELRYLGGEKTKIRSRRCVACGSPPIATSNASDSAE